MGTREELIGRRLGQYEVQAVIASGGMATLYRGFDVNLERPVALKVLSEEATAQADVVERFRREARLLATLRHPHIVQIFDFGEQEGYFYIVQELLPGPTLAQRLEEATAKNQTLPRAEVLAIIQQLALALDAAHAAGIIHRDVKPSNILWNSAGRLVLTDFGIAKQSSADAALTQTGQVLGTPAYVSPEQARGEALTAASDLYALGILLYELLAGHTPFQGATPMEVVLQHLEQEPPPLPAPFPADVNAVIERALAKEPSARFGSAAALAQTLARTWPEAASPQVDKATRSWDVVVPPPAAPVPVASKPVEQPTRAWQATPAPTPPTPPQSNRRGLPFLLVGGLLFLILAAVALRAWQGSGEVTAPGGVELSPIAQATSTVARPDTPAAATSVAAPSTTTTQPSPSAAPPTAQPSPTTAPTVAPSPTPPPAPSPTIAIPSADPISDLRSLLEVGIAAGLIEKQEDKLLKKLEEAERAIAEGDREKIQKALIELQREVLKGLEDERIDASFAERLLEMLDRTAAHHDLLLPSVDGEQDTDDEEDD